MVDTTHTFGLLVFVLEMILGPTFPSTVLYRESLASGILEDIDTGRTSTDSTRCFFKDISLRKIFEFPVGTPLIFWTFFMLTRTVSPPRHKWMIWTKSQDGPK